jgi:hypothetical protein
MNLTTVQQSMHKRAIELGWDTPILKLLSIGRKIVGPRYPDWSKPMPPPTKEPSRSLEEDFIMRVSLDNAKLRKEKAVRQEADKLYDLVKPRALEDPEKLKAEAARAAAEAADKKKWDDFHKQMEEASARVATMVKRREEEKLLASAQGPQLTSEQSKRLQERVGQVIALHKLRPDHTRAVLHGGKAGIRTANDRDWAQKQNDLKTQNTGVTKL